MNTRRLLIPCCVLAILLAASTALAAGAPTQTQTLRRFALVVGSNNGGEHREKLRYAGHDAESIADVLKQIGGVSAGDLSLLREPGAADLDRAFDDLSRRVREERKPGQRIELVVYYSGHADETGILVGGTHYDYPKLRDRIRAVPADVHIAIVDSCASGSFTRIKGGTKIAPFLRDSSNQVRGFAFLSSSAADEDAQESDRIGASFFTYFFVTGLRGAADRNRDGRITLTEAYQYAYEQTLGRTQNTTHGPQHPAYDMHLSGTGDVVITDLRATDSALVLPKELKGRVTIMDNSGRVAVELTKDAGEPMSVALPSETYSVHVENKDGEFVATVTLAHVGDVTFSPDAMQRVAPEKTVARGGDDADSDGDHDGDEHREEGPPGLSRLSEHLHDPWFRDITAGFNGGLRVELPQQKTDYDALVTLGGTMREIHGSPVIGVAETGELSLGATIGNNVGFAYDMHLGFGPGVFVGDNLQLGATIGFGFSGITSGVLPFGWEAPTEMFAVLELSPEIRPMAYVRQTYIFDSDKRQNGSKSAKWGDEAEAGFGLRFTGKLDGFVYGSVREMENLRFWGIGMGAVL